MGRRDFNDILGGAVLLAFGLFISLYAGTHYTLGTVMEMGPGMVPAGLGVLLAMLGAGIMVPAFFRTGVMPQVEWRPFLCVLAALAAFALMVDRVGLIPAIYALVFIAKLSDDDYRPVSSFVLATVLAMIVIGLFVYGLGMPFRLLTWDF